MRKAAVALLVLISVALVGTTVIFFTKYKKSVESYAEMKASDESTRLRYGQAINEIAQIQDSLNAIVLGEESVQGLRGTRQAEVELPESVHDQVLTRIAMLKGAIERTKERVSELDARLKRNGVKIGGLERMIASLKTTLDEKETRITELNTQVDTLQTQVSGLTVAVEDKDQQLTQKQQELATVFYTMGSKKELIRSGVVVSEGGVLGMGKTLKPSSNVNQAVLTPLDTDEEQIIRIPAEKARVLSAQPVTSYVIQPVGEKMVELRIVDPKEFRKVKQVVILMT